MIAAADIERYVEEIVGLFSPRQVILFGSYAYGSPTPDSDVDLLVVKPYRGPSQDVAAAMRRAVAAPFPLDLIVRSPAEIRRRIAANDFFLAEVTTKGLVLYAADDQRVGEQSRRRLRRHLSARVFERKTGVHVRVDMASHFDKS